MYFLLIWFIWFILTSFDSVLSFFSSVLLHLQQSLHPHFQRYLIVYIFFTLLVNILYSSILRSSKNFSFWPSQLFKVPFLWHFCLEPPFLFRICSINRKIIKSRLLGITSWPFSLRTKTQVTKVWCHSRFTIWRIKCCTWCGRRWSERSCKRCIG